MILLCWERRGEVVNGREADAASVKRASRVVVVSACF